MLLTNEPSPLPDRVQTAVPWIRVASGAPYFIDDAEVAWTPIGYNDSLTWQELDGVLGRRDLPRVERHLEKLKTGGVTVLRLMLEYVQFEGTTLETAPGTFNPLVVAAWDDLVRMCRRLGLRLLLTPFDTFFTWNNWHRHPYNAANGGPCDSRERLLTCAATRACIKRRLEFASRRWGADGTIFAWDIWNELHPVQGENRVDCFDGFIGDVAPWLRSLERRLHGRERLLTASVFGPELEWKPWLKKPIFRHPELDFASSHFYEEGTIDHPADTVAPALAVARLVREALAEIRDDRPFFDSEHGPIHTYKDHGQTLPEAFDDEYFRHIQWAHLAAGGAGGGMRWPNRDPHGLTPGMRAAQYQLSRFLPAIDWPRFRRRNLHGRVETLTRHVELVGCGDDAQALVYLLRSDTTQEGGQLDPAARPVTARLRIPDLAAGTYGVTLFETRMGETRSGVIEHSGGAMPLDVPGLASDLVVAICRRT